MEISEFCFEQVRGVFECIRGGLELAVGRANELYIHVCGHGDAYTLLAESVPVVNSGDSFVDNLSFFG